MLIITIRTDKPEAEVGIYDNTSRLEYEVWQAHRALSGTLHGKIQGLLKARHKTFDDIQGIVCYKGPGSFTGLRIGLTVGDALAYGLGVPIVGASGDDWIEQGTTRLQAGENDRIVLPHYGADAHITQPRR